MATNSAIEWTEKTWNPVTGCTAISPGCDNCYAERMAGRLQRMGQPRYSRGFEVTLQPDLVTLPTRWRKGSLIFVNSMSDLFHKKVPDEFIASVFEIMNRCPQHRFQVLTKRAKRLRTLAPQLTWTSNIWMGVSVESPRYYHRVSMLSEVPAATRFLSVEPMLERCPDLPLDGIDWVIVGGESGPGARPMQPDWVREVRNQCSDQQTAFFFKQWGGTNKKKTGRELDGRFWDELPSPRQAAV